ncbi:gustatory receptor for sugar taste 43a-like [Homalodisca vitripennis]|uniref:gustatory receptor for sugar taste 43a-like n=1 Tax=Homalodisca vitripennis TaxID=197043 RepID=UPI001EEA1801|nr:gustatory receptor for sugar taste 43a-like [Homalodisca vitripennis]
MHFMDRLDDESLRSLDKSIDIVITVDVVSLQVVAAVTFFSSAWKYPKLVSVFDTLERVYQELQHRTSDVKRAVKLLGIYAVALMLVTIFNRIVPMNHSGTSLEQEVFFTISFVTIVLLYFSQAALLVHFTHVAQSIAKSFEMVNAKIKMEVTSPASVDGTHTRCSILSKMKKLRTLMNTYWMLCDAVHQANVFYCDQLMAVTFSSFLHITVTSYYFFLLLKTAKMLVITNEGAWILLNICYVLLLLNKSTDVTNKADETGQMICKLINKDLDQNLRKQLEGFLLQLPHHNARFSARGFFPLNKKTLTAMAGAVTTYLVILIQFQTEPSST